MGEGGEGESLPRTTVFIGREGGSKELQFKDETRRREDENGNFHWEREGRGKPLGLLG